MNDNLKIEKMKYQTNKLSYSLILISLIFVITSIFRMSITWMPFGLNNEGFIVDIEILVTILLLLLIFLSAEKVKFYSKNYSILTIILGLFNIYRIFNLPMKLHDITTSENNIFPTKSLVLVIIELIIIALLLISAGIIGLYKHYQIKNFNKEVK